MPTTRVFALVLEPPDSEIGDLLETHLLHGLSGGGSTLSASSDVSLVSYRPANRCEHTHRELAREHQDRWMVAALVLNNVIVGPMDVGGASGRWAPLLELIAHLAAYDRPIFCFHAHPELATLEDAFWEVGASGFFRLPTKLADSAPIIRREFHAYLHRAMHR